MPPFGYVCRKEIGCRAAMNTLYNSKPTDFSFVDLFLFSLTDSPLTPSPLSIPLSLPRLSLHWFLAYFFLSLFVPCLIRYFDFYHADNMVHLDCRSQFKTNARLGNPQENYHARKITWVTLSEDWCHRKSFVSVVEKCNFFYHQQIYYSWSVWGPRA